MKFTIAILNTLLLFFAVNAYSEEASEETYFRAAEGVSFAYGHVKRSGGEMIADPNSATGFRWINTKLANVEETNRIPLKKGHGFHVQLLLFKLPAETASIKVSMTHPEMQLPSGQLLSNSTFMIPTRVSGVVPEASLSYTLDEDYELVAGDWVVTFSHAGKELYQITFVTYADVTAE